MRIMEVMEPEAPYIRDIKNVLVFLKMKGIKTVNTSAVIRELAKKGVIIDSEEIIELIASFPFIGDASAEKITFNGTDKEPEKVDSRPDEDDIDLDDERVKNMARSAMNRRK